MDARSPSSTLLVPAIGLLVLSLIAIPAVAQNDWSGEWDTRWKGGGATLSLRQAGDKVSGQYPLFKGRVEGTLAGRKVNGVWTEDQATVRQGKFEFILSADGRTFAGTFESGEWWNGTRIVGPRSTTGLDPDLTTARGVMRSFLVAGNLARGGAYDYQGTMLACVDLGTDVGDLPIGGQITRASDLFDLIDRTTLRVWDVPTGAGMSRVPVTFHQSGTGETIDLVIARNDVGRWRIVAPPPKDVADAARRLDAARGRAPGAADGDRSAHLRLGSPSDTMRTFVEAMRHGGPDAQEQLRSTLDLSQINPGLVGIEAPVVVDCLAQVLDRISYIILQEVPDDPKATSPYVHFEHPAGNVVITPTMRDGRRVWLFSPETVESIRKLYDAMETAERRGDLTTHAARPLFFRMRDRVRDVSPALLRQTLALENWQWLGLALLVPFGLLVGFLVTAPVRWLARRKLGEELFDDRTAWRLSWPLRALVLALFLHWGIGPLGLRQPMLRVAMVTVALLIGAGLTLTLYMVVHLTSSWLLRRARRDTATRFDDVLVALASAAAKIVVIVTGAVATAEFLALPYRSLLAGLGIGGLAIGLAAQDTLKSYFGAFGVVMDRPFRVGDWVRLGDVEGQVEAVRMRTIRVRRADNTLAVIPNAEVMRHSMSNLGRRNYRRQRVTFQVPFATPPQLLESFCQAARELIERHAKTGKERMLVYVAGFAESGVSVYVDYDLEAHDMESELRERHGLLLDIMRLAERMGVAFGVPTRTVRMVAAGGDDRSRGPSGNGVDATPTSAAAEERTDARPTP